MDRRFMGILGGIIVIFIAIFAISSHSSNKNGSTTTNTGAQPTSHIEGGGAKNVTLVEYGDYQCPICAIYYQPVKDAVAQEMADIHYQFRNLPLTSLHPNAFAAARAAEAAGKQDKFWQMHDTLYEHQSDWASSKDAKSIFEGYAKTLGLNVAQFDQDYSSNAVNDAINADSQEFAKTGEQMATPTFFLDGKFVDNSSFTDSTGTPSSAKLVALIKAEIASKK